MDPKLKEQIFIRKHKNAILIVIILVLLLPALLIFPQSGTQYRQQASEIIKTPISSNPPVTQPNINQTAVETQKDYTAFIKCYDKPNQTNTCSPAEREAADLNHDGIVNGVDYNLLIRQKAGQK